MLTRPTPRSTPHPRRVALTALGTALTAFLCALAHAPPSFASDQPPEATPSASARLDTLTSVWAVPFHEQSAWIWEMGFGSGDVGGQLDRVFDSGSFTASMNLGWRLGFISIELPFLFQTLESPVVNPLTLMSVGARTRAHLPLWGGSLRLTGGFGFHRVWATACDSDEHNTCAPTTSPEQAAFPDYNGNATDASIGVLVPLLSTWGDCSGCTHHCCNNCTPGGTEFLLGIEYRRTWYDLQNDALARTMQGHVDAIMVTLGFEIMFAD